MIIGERPRVPQHKEGTIYVGVIVYKLLTIM